MFDEDDNINNNNSYATKNNNDDNISNKSNVSRSDNNNDRNDNSPCNTDDYNYDFSVIDENSEINSEGSFFE